MSHKCLDEANMKFLHHMKYCIQSWEPKAVARLELEANDKIMSPVRPSMLNPTR